jgi:Asp-tRNA(Asn)/Glu-tRNA(Gln) amidotransferase A subunit family amidase
LNGYVKGSRWNIVGVGRPPISVGLQIVGRWHADVTVLRAAACFEAVQPWAQTRPPLA